MFQFHQESGATTPSFYRKDDANDRISWAGEATSKDEAVALGRQHPTARRPGLG